jgi:glycosyltransferase involved in cell wall biosynthesis
VPESDRDRAVVSAVIPVNNEEEVIADLVVAVAGTLASLQLPFEICIVDDGSTDGSWSALEALSNVHSEIRAVKLSRRFGKEAAILAGLQLARGSGAIVMDADLQHPPGLIPEMVRRWREDGFQVVDALKKETAGSSSDRWHTRVFYNLLAWFSGFRLHGSSDFKLLDRAVIDAYLSLSERGLFFRGLTDWLGFRHTSISFDVPLRAAGSSKWSLWQLARLALDAITTLSSAPLRLITGLGFFFLVFAIILGVQTLYRKLSGSSVDGFTTVILLLLIIGSALMVGLGVIGEYIARIFDEVKQRPRFVVERSIRR